MFFFLFPGLKMVIDFTAKWCGPCKSMEPIIQEFVAKYTKVEFIKIDVDELMVLLIYFISTLLLIFLIVSEKLKLHAHAFLIANRRLLKNSRCRQCQHSYWWRKAKLLARWWEQKKKNCKSWLRSIKAN